MRLVRSFYSDLWNRFDRSQVRRLLTDDVHFRGSLGQVAQGHEQFWQYVEFIRAAFPDFHNDVEDLVSEGERAFARLLYSGTHKGELFGVPASNRRISYAGAALFRVRGDRICSVWVLGDIHGLLGQLNAR